MHDFSNNTLQIRNSTIFPIFIQNQFILMHYFKKFCIVIQEVNCIFMTLCVLLTTREMHVCIYTIFSRFFNSCFWHSSLDFLFWSLYHDMPRFQTRYGLSTPKPFMCFPFSFCEHWRSFKVMTVEDEY